MFKKFLKRYYNWKFTYYTEQEIAKAAYMKIVEARHLERMSELKKREPFDADLAIAEFRRYDAHWDLLDLEIEKVSNKRCKYYYKWLKYI